MTTLEMNRSNTEQSEATVSPRAERFGTALLLVNGTLLGATALVAALGDLAGAFLDLGPMASSLHGNPQAIGFFEAHGLALILAMLLLVNRRAGGAAWNWVGAFVHLLLGAANLMFWPVFAQAGLVPMGIATTIMHAAFLVLEAGVALWRTPAILSGPGAWFRGLTLLTLATGAVLHGSSLPLGREAFIKVLFTPQFDAVFAIPMTAAGILGWVLYRRAVFTAWWQRVVYIAMLLYFTLSIFIHARTLFTWDTSYVLAFPSWYSLPIFVVFFGLGIFTIRQRFIPRTP
jgi:hypothetical protein